MWNLASSNKLCADRFTNIVKKPLLFNIQTHKKHLDKLQSMKPAIDNRAPEIPSFLRTRAKQEQIKESKS